METKGTPLYRKHLSEREIINIYKHLVEKNGIRSIERITGHHRDTIGRLLEDMAEHEVKNIRRTAFECDEIWRFVFKKRKMLTFVAQIGLKKAIQGFTHV